MRIMVHDFAGHPFQVQLSRALAARGHEVRHVHCSSEVTGKGALRTTSEDSPTLQIDGIEIAGGFRKYGLLTRWRQERWYGDLVSADAARYRPDIILSSNTPLFAQQRIRRWASANGIGFVFWVQDLLSQAIRSGANRRMPGLGTALSRLLTRVERETLAGSDGIVLISDDFLRILDDWKLSAGNVAVVENWAPLAELPQRARMNAWSRRHGLGDKRVLLYSGTLGMKHNPALLADLADAFRDRDDVRVVVVSEGLGATWLEGEVQRRQLSNVLQLPYQAYEDLPDVFASADVLLAILEPDAGAFSVPSKVLSYHCAGRPIAAAVPSANLAARVIRRERSGIVVDPGDTTAFIHGVGRLLDDRVLAAEAGRRARAYAELTFDIGSIVTRFERVLHGARTDSSIRSPRLRNQHA